ncbi:MAG: hypothetical protein DRJ03_01315 [Chloroflexi bacterium]|nr:MAG: hypothetical protein DRJ03_01315 [Chloroflexota bacterium]
MTEGRKRKFYRANLPTVVWDAGNDRALAEFVNGQFVTRDQDVAKKLLGLGYVEVDISADAPPPLPDPPIQPAASPDVPLAGAYAKEQAGSAEDDEDEKEVKPETEETFTGTDSPETPEAKEKKPAKKKASTKKKSTKSTASKKAASRSLKGRAK